MDGTGNKNIPFQSVKPDNKRELEDQREASSTQEGFKKARYSWQIKGKLFTDGKNEVPKSCIADKKGDKIADGAISELKIPYSVTEKQCKVNDDLESPLADCVSTEMQSEQIQDPQINIDQNTSELLNHTVSEAKEENLEILKSEYPRRIGVILKPQAKCSEFDQDSSKTICDGRSQRVPMLYKGVSESEPGNIGHHSGHTSRDTDKDTAVVDSPKHNDDLFNISSWLWQKQEIGCAIVDNVFNRTLEELGQSPDPEANLQATTRVSIENQSIEAAISQRGLAFDTETNEDTFDSIASTEESETETVEKSMGPCVLKPNSNYKKADASNEERCAFNCITGQKYKKGDTSEMNEKRKVSRIRSNQDSIKFSDVDNQRSKCSNIQEICSFSSKSSNEKINGKLKVASFHEVVNMAESSDSSVDISDSAGVDMNDCKSIPDTNRALVNIIDIAVSTTIMSKGLNIR